MRMGGLVDWLKSDRSPRRWAGGRVGVPAASGDAGGEGGVWEVGGGKGGGGKGGWREGGWREGGAEKGVGWRMQMASGSVAMICRTVEDGCYSFSSYLVSQQLSQYSQPLPLTVHSACTHHIRL